MATLEEMDDLLVPPFSEESDHERYKSVYAHDCGLGNNGITPLDIPDDSLKEDQNSHVHGLGVRVHALGKTTARKFTSGIH